MQTIGVSPIVPVDCVVPLEEIKVVPSDRIEPDSVKDLRILPGDGISFATRSMSC